MILTKATSLKGEITVPGDKSISHRGVMFGSISSGITELTGFLDGADCRSTISCFRKMGIDIPADILTAEEMVNVICQLKSAI